MTNIIASNFPFPLKTKFHSLLVVITVELNTVALQNHNGGCKFIKKFRWKQKMMMRANMNMKLVPFGRQQIEIRENSRSVYLFILSSMLYLHCDIPLISETLGAKV